MRSNNPNNYDPDFKDKKGRKKKGKIKKGKKQWNNSKTYKKDANKLREIQRKQAAQRKTSQRCLVNKVLSMGDTFKLEKVSIKGWQKLWGRSIGYKAPGFFQSELIRKAESAGGVVHQFSTQKTALSQTCICGQREKKPLHQRIHDCSSCHLKMHRDLFSGFLARYVDSEEKLSLESARDGWLGMEPSLQAEWKRWIDKTNKSGDSFNAASVMGLELVAAKSNNLQEVETRASTRNLDGDLEPPGL